MTETKSGRGIRVLIVDDHAIFRSGVRRLLSDESDMRISDEARHGAEALVKLRTGGVDLVLLDINLAGRSGLEVLTQIRAEWPKLPVIMLSMYPQEQYAAVALRGGARGYVSKDMESDDLVAAIRVVMAGGQFVSANVMRDLWQAPNPALTPDDAPPHHRLTHREFQVLLGIAGGKSLTDMGKEMCLSVKTVSTYRSRVLEKLGLGSNADLVRYALQKQLRE